MLTIKRERSFFKESNYHPHLYLFSYEYNDYKNDIILDIEKDCIFSLYCSVDYYNDNQHALHKAQLVANCINDNKTLKLYKVINSLEDGSSIDIFPCENKILMQFFYEKENLINSILKAGL